MPRHFSFIGPALLARSPIARRRSNDRVSLVLLEGDEPKWQRTYEKGEAVFVDEPMYDASSHASAVQLSLPLPQNDLRCAARALGLPPADPDEDWLAVVRRLR